MSKLDTIRGMLKTHPDPKVRIHLYGIPLDMVLKDLTPEEILKVIDIIQKQCEARSWVSRIVPF